jgi:hypothetical protein
MLLNKFYKAKNNQTNIKALSGKEFGKVSLAP